VPQSNERDAFSVGSSTLTGMYSQPKSSAEILATSTAKHLKKKFGLGNQKPNVVNHSRIPVSDIQVTESGSVNRRFEFLIIVNLSTNCN
jgi:hypothetical protein